MKRDGRIQSSKLDACSRIEYSICVLLEKRESMEDGYILATPAKNEEDFLPEMATSIISQSIKPKLWIIVNDGSTDSTPRLLEDLAMHHNWIKILTLKPEKRDLMFHYSTVCNNGFYYAIDYCNKDHIDYEYIALADADTVLEKSYFEKIIEEFGIDKELGIASGGIYLGAEEALQPKLVEEYLPLGTGRLWRKECFMSTGGYLEGPSPDSISNVKAMLHGWKIKRFRYTIGIQKRKTSSAEGLWNGYKSHGRSDYYLNKGLTLIALNTAYLMTQKPHYIGLAYCYGYLLSLLKNEEKIKDEEIKEYYQNKRLKEWRDIFIRKIKNCAFSIFNNS
jgi:glycosyltransferase involved in cell wall biosynthesis